MSKERKSKAPEGKAYSSFQVNGKKWLNFRFSRSRFSFGGGAWICKWQSFSPDHFDMPSKFLFFFSARHGGSSKGFPGSNLHAQQISDFSASNENVFKTTLSMPINNILIFFFCVVSNRQIILCGCLSFLFNMQ